MTPSERRDMMLLYVAEALDAREHADIEQWLASGDPNAAAALAEARATLAHLPMALEPETPSPAMWSSLEQRIRNEGHADAAPFPINKATAPAGISPFSAFATAALLAIVASLATFVITETAHRDERNQLAELQTLYADQQQQILTLTTELNNAANTVQLLSAPALKIARLEGTPERPGALATMRWDDGLGRFQLTVEDLPPAPAGRDYQLWFVPPTGPGDATSLGVFAVDDQGRATYNADFDPLQTPIVAVAVSLEPLGGVPSPTGPIVMLGTVN